MNDENFENKEKMIKLYERGINDSDGKQKENKESIESVIRDF